MSHVAVIDIGKSNAKVVLVQRLTGREGRVLTRANRVLAGPPWPHFDTEGLWHFILQALRELSQDVVVDGIVTTTHGASAALLDGNGALAAPVLDYECPGPDGQRADYEKLRPDFARSGSPPLPLGLNLGAQFYWQFQTLKELRAKVATVLTLPQYWGFRLCGNRASDLCSLGCHTDLWLPFEGIWSPLAERLGIAGKLVPAQRPDEVLGNLLPEIQRVTGLGAIPVLTGIHDSNASLLPHLMSREPPFAVVSTGTWVISMAIGGRKIAPDPARDTLINVDAFGRPVPSARYMGGREYALLTKGLEGEAGAGDEAEVLARGRMILPSVVAESGPFPGQALAWVAEPAQPGERLAAAGYYLALMTAESLALTGAEGAILVEGPFAANACFKRMLSAATGRKVIASAGRTGTAAGAALLFGSAGTPVPEGETTLPDPDLATYAATWRERVLTRKPVHHRES